MMNKDKCSTVHKKKNVQVVVRVRPLSDKERAERSHLAVRTNGLAQTVSLKERSSWREFGPFDKVYGIDSSQSTIYMDIVDPLIKEVIQGYNCTVFAYGQTGTGKTYTMEGEHDPNGSYSWKDDPHMGIIPRALMHIFTELDRQKVEEYSVRVSYVELYNEELYDLLSRSDQQQPRLRIFEDAIRKGSVVIAGLEEVAVRERDEVYELLRRGAEKRKTAATWLNSTSSRSHSVFTVTLVIRENSLGGEELIKQGKIHLVDLAGSENIGRSGAIEMRAREAGNINQSLLTLGRVIKALTSGAGHIPYRESKLTRLLQDSLGGKTITTVIATLSPASSNLEESLNTLEYASSAKNIKNHPEINQKLSRRDLLKQYNNEVEKLRRDLQAARDKNGIYVDKENFEEMEARIAEQTEQIDDLTDKLGATMSQLQTLMQDIEVMDEHYARAYERCVHLTNKLTQRNEEIAALKVELSETKSELEYQKRALKVLQEAGDSSESQAVELIENCEALSDDLERAHDKIDSLRGVCTRNAAQLEELRRQRETETNDITTVVDSWNQITQQEASVMDSHCERLLSQLRSSEQMLSKQMSGLIAQVEKSAKEMEKTVNRAHEEAIAEYGNHTDNVLAAIEEMKQLNANCVNIFMTLVATTRKGVDSISQQHIALVKSMDAHLKAEEESFSQRAEQGRERQKCLEVLKEDLHSKIQVALKDFMMSSASISGEVYSSIEKEREECHKSALAFRDTQMAQITAGDGQLKQMSAAASNAASELDQNALLFDDEEGKLRAAVEKEKDRLVTERSSLRTSIEHSSTAIRNIATSECHSTQENLGAIAEAALDSASRIMDAARLNELSETKSELEYQKRALKVLQEAGDSSESQAVELIENCEALSDDLERAHDKIDSLRGVCTRNAAQLEELRRQRETETNDITTVVDSWNQITQQEASVMDSHCERLLSQLRSSEQMLSKQMSGLIAQVEKSAKEMEKTVNRAHEEAIAEYGNHTDNVLAAIEEMKQLNANCVNIFMTLVATTRKGVDSISQQHIALVKSMDAHLKAEEESFSQRAEQGRERQKCLEVLKEDLHSKIQVALKDFMMSSASISGEVYSSIEKEREECHKSALAFRDTQMAQITAGDGQLKQMSAAASNAASELDQNALLFDDEEGKLRAAVEKEKDRLVTERSSLRTSIEHSSTAIRNIATSECHSTQENLGAIAEAALDSASRIMDAARLNASRSESNTEKIKSTLAFSQETFDDFVTAKFETPVSSGETPSRVARSFPIEAVKIPDAGQLLQEWSQNASPKRRSFYRPRESLLEVPSNVLSPQTLKGVRPKLDDVSEYEDEYPKALKSNDFKH
ncbi:Kinesin-like protein KIF11 [Toxocara canis]|uniref:Kinesin-like protein KIF11 n=1 Tax=Toxocara canis TaxID=6265 RepID=A0A0B2VHZ4_TOXCA|nr:Kinesin-like protein KIF11 [Toxocara canis]